MVPGVVMVLATGVLISSRSRSVQVRSRFPNLACYGVRSEQQPSGTDGCGVEDATPHFLLKIPLTLRRALHSGLSR